ncbi:hypothetical protein C8R47DRAFT_1235986 [Mycena vitilis]|nr:hypothetical protein C8R47DRAFT_1235986 [Mycena vitilis]
MSISTKEWLARFNALALEPRFSSEVTPPVSPEPSELHKPTEYEPPPPVPEHLVQRRRECVYGFCLIDAFMQARFDAHPLEEPEPPRSTDAWKEYKLDAMYNAGDRVGLHIFLEHVEEGDVAYFSCTDRGIIAANVPAAPHLKRYADELGITEPAQWYCTKAPYYNVHIESQERRPQA